MFKTKVLVGLLLVVSVLFAQVGMVFAAPAEQEATPITGTITNIQAETDSNGVTTVLVTLQDNMGATQTVRISTDTAVALGLVTVDPTTNTVIVDQTKVGQPVTIDPSTVIPDQQPTEPTNPIAAILAAFFGADANTVNQYHEEGFGFGVIAQALWISKNVNGDASLAGLILQAKKSGDYSNIMLADGTSLTLPDGTVPTNWGQFKKALLEKKNNLGVIVSGHAQPDDGTSDVNSQQDHGNGKNNGKGNGNGHGNGKGNGNGNKP
jgi:hypothetical protein